MSKIPEFFQDPLIILIVFSLFMIPTIRDAIAKNIPQVGMSGDVPSFTNIITMGIIIGLGFAIAKKFMK